MEPTISLAPRSLLFVPAARTNMITKAAGLPADLIVLDLEDAVRADEKAAARAALPAAIELLGGRSAVRVNAPDTDQFAADLRAIGNVPLVVVPKVERAADVGPLAGRAVLAMIETPRGVLAAAEIAAVPGVVGLMIGTNDLAAELRLPPGGGRAALTLALQSVVLAARAAGGWAIDGVFNALADPDGLARECAEGRALGFDGKSLIHPGQIAAANAAFSPSTAELEEAGALIAAATGGAERFRDRMIEAMHVETARRLLERAR
ncbi:HpcH/HpaI aldolase/citrate lyase family protein [Sphingomonas sp. Leaf10]|uniref:HpcH/HpaI aldolase/citrate lyase family protein n=1 Tax=Sphingomonas sp. Leaf10 TaxID=1735676 RepID=UPI0006F5AAC5|nr:CoA ester lyase [Sphingomonas sp. Leaf10]KQM41259.1 citryl-CoA lyase [Sphingomonas sp. Leaf10]